MTGIKKMARGLVALAVSAGGLAFAGTVEAAHGGNVHCGDTITANTTLSADVVDETTGGPCQGTGVFMSSGVTLDLNGYTIKGDVAFNADTGLDEAGISFDGVNGATVTDSGAAKSSTTGRWEHPSRSNQVTGFDAGVAIVGGYNNRVLHVNVEANVGTDGEWLGEGIHLRNTGGTSYYGLGGATPGNLIKDNTLTGNGPYDGIGVVLNSDYNTLEGNDLRANAVTHQDIGIRLEQDTTLVVPPATCATKATTDYNKVQNNSVTGSAIDGISVLGAHCPTTGNQITGNIVSNNGLNGIRLNNKVTLTTVTGNTVCGNGGAGIRIFLGATGNTVSGNTAGLSVAGPACLPNNPIVEPPVPANPLLPPHGDLHDDHVLLAPCTTPNVWQNNLHLTEFAGLGSTLSVPPGPWVVDYQCIA